MKLRFKLGSLPLWVLAPFKQNNPMWMNPHRVVNELGTVVLISSLQALLVSSQASSQSLVCSPSFREQP